MSFDFSKYGKDDKLYPKDVVTRAIVDQRLYFDMGTFYKAIGDVMVCRIVFYNLKIINNYIFYFSHFILYSIHKCLADKKLKMTSMKK